LARRQQLNVFPQPITLANGTLVFPCGPTASAACPNPVPSVINPNFTGVEWMSSDVNSEYDALNVSLEKRFSRGLTFKASYTWSRSIDDQSASESNYTGNPVDGQWGPDRTLDRGQSSFNVPQAFVANWIYELPVGSGKKFLNSGGVTNAVLGGWQLGGIFTAQQGVPFTVSSSAAYPGYFFNANRPNIKAGIDVNSIVGGPPTRYFDPTVFTVPPAGTLGNAARNLLRGPGLTALNFSLNKFFSIGERLRLQFRAEIFNLLNHPNFQLPNSNVFTNVNGTISPNAGIITQIVGSSRQIQFGLKITF
jgi:hypothetical protein